MTSTIAAPIQAQTKPFSNEPVSDFSKPANREAMERALRDVRAQLGREYDLLIAGRREKTPDKLKSLNPSRPGEVVGVHSKATAALAKEAVEAAHAYYPVWGAVPAEERARKLARALNACRAKGKPKRKVCEAQARRRYGPGPAAKARRDAKEGK